MTNQSEQAKGPSNQSEWLWYGKFDHLGWSLCPFEGKSSSQAIELSKRDFEVVYTNNIQPYIDQWQQSQPGIKQWVSESELQAQQFVRELDWLTTKEFCEKYNIELPSWKGNVQLAASEFIRLDAIKWNMTKEFVKHGIKNSTTTPESDMVSKTDIINKLQALKDFHQDEGNSMSSIAIGEAIEKIKEK